MASEYYKKKFKDVKKDEVVEMTQKEKVINWWHYHWVHVLLSIVAVIGVALVIKEFFFVTKADYKIAIVGTDRLDVETEELCRYLEQYGEDVNGDGKVVVKARTYMPHFDGRNDTAEEMVAISSDISVGNSQIFIVKDLEGLNERFEIIDEGNYYLWEECPELKELKIGDGYYIAIRSYDVEKQAKEGAHAWGLWEKLIAGVK